jgi:hypothetical protein
MLSFYQAAEMDDADKLYPFYHYSWFHQTEISYYLSKRVKSYIYS